MSLTPTTTTSTTATTTSDDQKLAPLSSETSTLANTDTSTMSSIDEERTPVLVIEGVSCARPDLPSENIFEGASFTVYEGDVVALRARSGVGKTTLLKCLAHLNMYEGSIKYRGKTPMAYGVPTYRTHIQYVPQRPSLLPKTPRDFLDTLNTFRSRRKVDKAVGLEDYHNVWDVARSWGIDDELWDRVWNTLSGGESQRIALAIAFGLNTAEVLLLDEPTSALDATTSELVEKTLVNGIQNPETNLKAIIWITHSEEQSQRVATRTIQLTPTKVVEEPVPDV